MGGYSLPGRTWPGGVAPFRVLRFLELSGPGGGHELVGNYALGGVDAWVGPSPGVIWAIRRILIYIQATAGFRASYYGTIDLSAGTGIHVMVDRTSTGETLDLDDGVPLKSNADISRHCYDTDYLNYGVGDNALAARWTFSKGGSPVILDGSFGDRLLVQLRDDLSGLNSHTIKADGVILEGPDEWT